MKLAPRDIDIQKSEVIRNLSAELIRSCEEFERADVDKGGYLDQEHRLREEVARPSLFVLKILKDLLVFVKIG